MPHVHYVYGPWPMLAVGVLFWGSVVALIVWAIHRLTNRGGMDSTPPSRRAPMDYLKERYAKGEITKEQFDQMKRDLLDGG
ncbi:MAG: SHOCT domain-containing protein [Thermotogota bacterium]